MKTFLLLLTLGTMLASCAVSTEPELSSNPQAYEYFFPQSVGDQYVYSEGTAPSASDTTTYQSRLVDANIGSYMQLISTVPSNQQASPVLYYFKVEQAKNVGSQCILSSKGSSDRGLVVLQGDLSIGSFWNADSAGSIVATVVGRYVDYFSPGASEVYHDVVVVKYIDSTTTDGSYIVRFFARDYGLILERTVLANASEVLNLQLLKKLSADGSGSGNPKHDPWYDVHGRYIMRQANDDQIK